MKEDRLVNIFSSLKEAVYHLIKSSFMLDGGEFYFDNPRVLQLMGDLFHTLLRETSIKMRLKIIWSFLQW